MARKHSARRTHRRRATHKRRHTRRSHTRRQQKQQQRKQQKQQRGGMMLGSAPISYHLADGWSSRASLAQGDDFTKYHAQQHGGSAPYPAAVSGVPFLAPAGTAIAMTAPLDRALADVAGFKDPEPTLYVDAAGRMGAPTTQDSPGAASMAKGVPEAQPQAGGKRKHGRKHGRKTHKAHKGRKAHTGHKGSKGHKGSRKHRRSHRSRRHRGGGLGYAPVGAPGLLLPSKVMYDEAGLNPDYRGAATEYAIAEIRDQQ
jgi:hypothetical protein